MFHQLSKLGLLTASAAVSLLLLEGQSAQAARFSFSLPHRYNADFTGSGELSFNHSSLTGIGTETISFSQLQQSWSDAGGMDAPPQFNYHYQTELAFTSEPEVSFWGNNSNATFSFLQGELIGINLDNASTDNFSSSDSRYGLYHSYGTATLAFQDNLFKVLLDYTTDRYEEIQIPIFDEDGNYIGWKDELVLINKYHREGIEDIGTIEFKTLEPIEAIPEPLTILGVGTAIGFGAFFKYKISQKR